MQKKADGETRPYIQSVEVQPRGKKAYLIVHYPKLVGASFVDRAKVRRILTVRECPCKRRTTHTVGIRSKARRREKIGVGGMLLCVSQRQRGGELKGEGGSW